MSYLLQYHFKHHISRNVHSLRLHYNKKVVTTNRSTTGWAKNDGHAECCLNWNVYDISVNCEF